MGEAVGIAAPKVLPQLVLVAAGVVGIFGLLVAGLQKSDASLYAYVLALLVGTALIAVYRWLEVRRSISPEFVFRPRWERRLAFLPVLLVLAACAANAFVWATEVAKT